MFDFLDMETVRDEDYMEGSFYKRRPKTPNDYAVPFVYSEIDSKSRSYYKILQQLKSDQGTYTIKTRDNVGWKVNSYIVAQDGTMYQVVDYRKIMTPQSNKEALRVVKQSNSTEFVVRLLEVENPWGLQ